MQDPAKEIPDVVNLVTAAVNPEIQKVSVLRYAELRVLFRWSLTCVLDTTRQTQRSDTRFVGFGRARTLVMRSWASCSMCYVLLHQCFVLLS